MILITQREYEVLHLFSIGYDCHQISNRLNISKKTTEHHIFNILTKTRDIYQDMSAKRLKIMFIKTPWLFSTKQIERSKLRLLIYMYYRAGYSLGYISFKFNLPENNIYNILSHIKYSG